MPGCKYVGDGTDKCLSEGEQCRAPVMLDADKSQPSKKHTFNDGKNFVYMFPSKKHESGLCFYHWNKLRCRKAMKEKGSQYGDQQMLPPFLQGNGKKFQPA